MGNCIWENIIGDAFYRFWSIFLYIIMVGWLWTNLFCVNMKMFRALKALVNYHCKELQDIDHIFTIPAFFTDKCLKTIDVTCQNIL